MRPRRRRHWALTVATGLGFAVALFFLLPATITKLAFGAELQNGLAFVATVKALRLTIFLTYLVAVSRLNHLRRVFQYHSAEHQAIACLEAGAPLTPEQAAQFPRLHPRCGTSFMFVVMLTSLLVFAPLGNLPLGWLLLSRIVGLPLVAGLAFEAIKWMGRRRDLRLARALTWPGHAAAAAHDAPSEIAHLEVAIAALLARHRGGAIDAASDDAAVAFDLAPNPPGRPGTATTALARARPLSASPAAAA